MMSGGFQVCMRVLIFVAMVCYLVSSYADCPDGFTYFACSCYKFHTNPGVQWETARNACAEYPNGGHLVFIQSEAEQVFLQTLAVKESAGNRSNYWIGITASTERELQWLDGSPLKYTAWDSDGVRANGRDCVRLRFLRDFRWNDRICSIEYGYVCETKSLSCHLTFTDFIRASSVGMAAISEPIHGTMTSSLSRCALCCSKNEKCKSFNFNVAAVGNRLCELFSSVFKDGELHNKPGFAYYTPN